MTDPVALYHEHEAKALAFARATRIPIDEDDVEQEARIGLWHACQRWTPARGSFWTYAYLRVRGAVMDAARALHPGGRGDIARRKKLGLSPSRTYGFYVDRLNGDDLDQNVCPNEPSIEDAHPLDDDDEARAMLGIFSTRTRTILALRAKGLSHADIATALCISQSRITQILAAELPRLRAWREARGLHAPAVSPRAYAARGSEDAP